MSSLEDYETYGCVEEFGSTDHACGVHGWKVVFRLYFRGRYFDCIWLAWDDEETLGAGYREFLETMNEEFGQTLQHVIIRTVPSIVSVTSPSTFPFSSFPVVLLFFLPQYVY